MDRKENYIVWVVYDYYILFLFFLGREDFIVFIWGGVFGGGFYCVFLGVYYGRFY